MNMRKNMKNGLSGIWDVVVIGGGHAGCEAAAAAAMALSILSAAESAWNVSTTSSALSVAISKPTLTPADKRRRAAEVMDVILTRVSAVPAIDATCVVPRRAPRTLSARDATALMRIGEAASASATDMPEKVRESSTVEDIGRDGGATVRRIVEGAYVSVVGS